MTYHKYKNKIVKGLAIFLASMMILGAIAPVVFAEEGNPQAIEQQQDSVEEQPPVEVKPPVWNTTVYPNSEKSDVWFNQEALYHDHRYDLYYDDEIYYDSEDRPKERIFLKVAFSIDKGELTLAGIANLISGVSVYGDSSNISMVDVDFLNEIDNMENDTENPQNSKRQQFIDQYIFAKSADKKSATLYIPMKPLMSHMTYSVSLSPSIVYETQTNQGNDSISWNFNTMAIPSVTEKDVVVQSVTEDYDINEPIIIEGKFFYDPTVDVYFNDTRAYRVRVRENDKGEEYLEVYLPRGRYQLDPGLYNITVENSSQHSKWLYGTLSVVAESNSNIPEEDTTYGTNTQYGAVSGARRSEVIRLDHAEPIKEQILRNNLLGYTLKSPIVQVDISSTNVSTFLVEIPIDMGEYENYKVFRYNEVARKWEEESRYSINKVDQRAEVKTFSPGIFVVVEPKY